MKSLRSRAMVYGLVIVLGLLSAMPNLLPANLADKFPDWYLENTLPLRPDWQGGSHLLRQVDATELLANNPGQPEDLLLKDAVERSLEVVRRRLDETGLVEPSITRQGKNHILVQMPGVADPAHIRELLGTTAQMTFHWVAKPEESRRSAILRLTDTTGEQEYVLEKRVAMQGEHISDAQMAFNQDTTEPVVNFKLDSEGTRLFGDMTRQNIGRPLAIVLDNHVITAPVIRSVIAGGSGESSGSSTTAEASNLAL